MITDTENAEAFLLAVRAVLMTPALDARAQANAILALAANEQ